MRTVVKLENVFAAYIPNTRFRPVFRTPGPLDNVCTVKSGRRSSPKARAPGRIIYCRRRRSRTFVKICPCAPSCLCCCIVRKNCKAGLTKEILERQHLLLNNCGQVVSLWCRVDGLKQRLQAAEKPQRRSHHKPMGKNRNHSRKLSP